MGRLKAYRACDYPFLPSDPRALSYDIEAACLHEVLVFCMDKGATISVVRHSVTESYSPDHDRRSPYHIVLRIDGRTVAEACTIEGIANALAEAEATDVQ